MPAYDYKCKSCAHIFEVTQSITEAPLSECPKCKGPVFRLIGKGVGVQFVGSGFYANDSRKTPAQSESPKPAAGATSKE